MFSRKLLVGNTQTMESIFDVKSNFDCTVDEEAAKAALPAEQFKVIQLKGQEPNRNDNFLSLSERPEASEIRLLVGKMVAEVEDNPIFGKVVHYRHDYSGDMYVSLNTVTGEIKFNNLEPDFIAGKKWDDASIHNALAFEMEVVQMQNLFFYKILTDETTYKILGFCEDSRTRDMMVKSNIAANIMRNLNDVSVFEKILKVSGVKFLFSNLSSSDNFQLGSGKKLNRVMGVPEEVRKFIKAAKIEALFPCFQRFCHNPNDGKELVEYLQFVKKVRHYSPYELNGFITTLANLMDTQNDVEFRQVLAHIIREAYFFGEIEALPTTLVKRWIDCFTMAKAAGIVMDKCPQNITKYHAILQKNLNILDNPREEEFEEAVSLYSRLTKEMKEEGYIIRPPRSEQELVEEGNVLHHCVATYRDKIIDEKCIVLFCRKLDAPDVPLYTIELDYAPGDTVYTVSQFKGMFDADVTDPKVNKMLKEYLSSKLYIIEGGKNLFRKPHVAKPKKDEAKEEED